MADAAKRQSYKTNMMRLAKATKGEEFANISKSGARSTLEILNKYWEKYLEHHEKVVSEAGVEDVPFQEVEMIDGERLYMETLTLINNRLEALSIGTPQAASSSGQQNIQVITRAEIPLPPMNIPTFTGKSVEWMEFIGLFRAHIHNKERLTNAQKFQYLKSKLDGEAAQLVKNYPLTDANYPIALASLTARYENQRLIAYAHLKALFGIPAVKGETSASLRRLIDSTNDCVRALNGLNINTESWDSWLTFFVTQKLDTTTILEWERTLVTPNLPTMLQLTAFIESRCRAIEAVSSSRQSIPSIPSKPVETVAFQATATPMKSIPACAICSESHYIHACPKFLAMSVAGRNDAIRERRLCFNCFNTNHSSRICKSRKCNICSRKHHSLLHPPNVVTSAPAVILAAPVAPVTPLTPIANINAHHTTTDEEIEEQLPTTVLLATACVTVLASNGTEHIARALLDTGSQASFISEPFAQMLKLKRNQASIRVNGLGSCDAGTSHGMVRLTIGSQVDPTMHLVIDALVLSHITAYLPNRELNQQFPHLEGLELADKEFHKPGKIDILLGADVYAHVILDGILRGASGTPIAQKTSLGWILSGRVTDSHSTTETLSLHASLETQLKRFWEIETIPETDCWTNEEQVCDDHYKRTHSRTACGKFVVQFPLKSNVSEIGSSKPVAIARLKQLESKFKRNPQHKERYVGFMREYAALGHMTCVPNAELHSPGAYYIPHHAVIKEESTTTKLRVVFDASCKSTTGISLNDCQMIGPKLQPDLYVILLRFRKYAIAITADVAKMYRQILMHPSHQDFQRIVWRENDNEDIQEYRLSTVTYGTASAPFLAIKSLIECARVEGIDFLKAQNTIINDMYVDDLITGADNERDATDLHHQVSFILAKGGFQLRKWASNSATVLENIPANHRESKEQLLFKDEDSVKALGIHWYPTPDNFGYVVKMPTNAHVHTKRSVLADTARLFDPLGLLSPVIVTAKILLQKLWLLGVDWDEQLPDQISAQWTIYRQELHSISRIKIPRWLGTTTSGSTTQLHGFCDASEAAYAAVIYARSVTANGKVNVCLITSKTKVAPVQQISLPRLELCGAVLLAKLLKMVKAALNFETVDCYAWSDSTVVLSWLQKLPCHWKTFVANRVSQIQSSLDPSQWKYVPSKENPADVASRGIYPSELENHSIWWHGPAWLRQDEKNFPSLPRKSIAETKLDERKSTIVVMTSTILAVGYKLIDKYSSLNRLKMVTAYVRRFIFNAQRVQCFRHKGAITPTELDESLNYWIVQAQRTAYPEELSCIDAKINLPRKSKLLSLSPYLDNSNLLRVGGRIKNAQIPHNAKHQIILPPLARVSQLIFAEAHSRLLHGGVQLMTTHLRQDFWIPKARSIIRQYIHAHCVPCFRQRRHFSQQVMGNLPSQRLTPARAFLKTGVDYAGPINLKTSEIRNSKIVKGYIAVFVCLVTRAIHLEIVSDLTTEAFIAAFRRFVARRGKCQLMMSDNGSNFIGAQRELRSLTDILQSQHLANQLAQEHTEWQLIPPSAPHFGGIWEAGVKSVKHHLRRVLGTHKLTFEKMNTLLTQIEACLNSRPLIPLSDDPADLNALTPGHFLIGEPMSAVPDPNVMDIKQNRLSIWQLMQQIQQDFWLRWSKEYLSELQQRPKWKQPIENVKVGSLVIIKDECLPPTFWPLARVTETHPGEDGMVRVVTLRHSGGIFKRPIHKICVLPTSD